MISYWLCHAMWIKKLIMNFWKKWKFLFRPTWELLLGRQSFRKLWELFHLLTYRQSTVIHIFEKEFYIRWCIDSWHNPDLLEMTLLQDPKKCYLLSDLVGAWRMLLSWLSRYFCPGGGLMDAQCSRYTMHSGREREGQKAEKTFLYLKFFLSYH